MKEKRSSSKEQALIRLAARRDPRAQEELFEKYRSMVFRVGWRILGDREDALEVVQETFVKVFANLDRFEGRSSLKTWIARIAANAALDLGRARSARPDIGAGAPREELTPARAESPLGAVQRRELEEALRLCLGTLRPSLAAVIGLFTDGGLTYAEIAEALNVAQGTVMSRLFYARRKLRECLEAKGFKLSESPRDGPFENDEDSEPAN